MGLTVVHTRDHVQAAITRALRGKNEPSCGFVPTMGALHKGHMRLMEKAAAAHDVSVASIFVNPLQFNDRHDLDRYPRTLDRDIAVLESSGVDILFAPSVEHMYPSGEPVVTVNAGKMGVSFEGACRRGHFNGTLTVVSKLLHIVQPSVTARYCAYFGRKDAQQLALIRRMVTDFNIPVEVIGVETVREHDGLALSSRNRFLDPLQRQSATSLYRALQLLAAQARAGEIIDINAAQRLLQETPFVEVDYLALVDPDSFEPLPMTQLSQRPGLVIVAAQIGGVRLLDNMLLPVGGQPEVEGER